MFKSHTRSAPAHASPPPTPRRTHAPAPAPAPAAPPNLARYPPETHTLSSPHEYSRTPSTVDVVFGLGLSYHPPRNALARALWRRRVWFETTFALSMLQPWEKVLVMTILYATILLLCTGVALYLPQHLDFLRARAAYYFLGREPDAAGSSATYATVASSMSAGLSSAAGALYDAVGNAPSGLRGAAAVASQAVARWGRYGPAAVGVSGEL